MINDLDKTNISMANIIIDNNLRSHINRDMERLRKMRRDREKEKEKGLYGVKKKYLQCHKCCDYFHRDDMVPGHWHGLKTQQRLYCRECEEKILKWRYENGKDRVRRQAWIEEM